MEKRLTMILVCLFLSIGMALAQTRVTGTVVSSADDLPVIGASIKIVGTNTGTITNSDGEFSLTVTPGTTLEISYIGMQTKRVKAASNLKVVLEPDNQNLDEVVVVGYGSARKIGTITGSVVNVNAEKLKNAPSASALDALQGQVAGLNVLTSSGEAGDNAVSMNIHGIGSLGASSTPLYVIDGIPSSSRTIMAMNPNDIKSISVLKDASATSIYGSRAANGVIYVTTKSGGFNSKAQVTYRTQLGWNTLASMKLYKNMMNAAELKDFWLSSGLMSQATFDSRYTSKGYDTNDTKWYNYFQQFNTPQTQNDLTIEGGGEHVAYLIGASQFHQVGTAIGNFFDRYTFRSNIDAKPKEWLRTGMNISFAYDKRQRNGNWGNSDNMSNYTSGGLSYLLNPFWPALDENGKVYEQVFPGQNRINPNYDMQMHPYLYQRYGLIGNAYVEIEPVKNLKIRSRVGTDMYFVRDNWLTYPSYIRSNGSGSKGKSMDFNYSATMTNTIEYNFDIAEDHHFTVLFGQEGTTNTYDYFYATSTGQTSDKLMNLQNGKQSSYGMSESATASRFLSFFGRLDYNLMDRYFIDLTVRNDASSRFGANNRNATFWAAGVMWKLKNEEFLKPYSWINNLDFKVSYGTQGNASIGDYPSLGLLGVTTDYNESPAWVYAQPANPNLTWEKQKLFTIGVVGRFFNRLDLDLAYYVRKTSDMLMDVPYPYTTGFSSMTSNVGTLQNTGFDVKVGYQFLRTSDYYLNASVNFNYNWQKITELFQGRSRWEIANTMVAYVVDSPVMYYLPLWAGVDKSNGAPLWYKAGDDVDKTSMTETTSDYDEAALTQNSGKKRYAPFNGGFNISAGWKGLSISADFSVVLGKYLIDNDGFFYANFAAVGTSFTQRKDVANYWREDNTDAKYPDWRQGWGMQFDSHLLKNASFMRLKNLQVGYNLPKSLLNWQNVLTDVKFTFTGRNLWTVTGYGGIDPEVDSNLTYGVTGNSKQYLFGLEVTF